jgi:hypothetical protein
MITVRSSTSQRLLRKGALVQETYCLFQSWSDEATFPLNFDLALSGALGTLAWQREVKATLSARFGDFVNARPLLLLARSGMQFDSWLQCYSLWIGIHELLFRNFVCEWLYPEYVSGRFIIRTEDVVHHMIKSWDAAGKSHHLSEYGSVRSARDLLRMARDLHILHGNGPEKTFSSIHLNDQVALFVCHLIAEYERTPSKVPSSNLWKIFLMSAESVHEILLRLHQYKKLEYHFAGSLVQLTLPFSSTCDYVERMAA